MITGYNRIQSRPGAAASGLLTSLSQAQRLPAITGPSVEVALVSTGRGPDAPVNLIAFNIGGALSL